MTSTTNNTSNTSIPEPKPINKGIPIYPIAVNNVKKFSKNDKELTTTLTLLEKRYNFGVSKYGQPLMSNDGRDDIEDCLQEIGDAIQYLSKALYNKKDITPLRDSLEVLYRMVINDERKEEKSHPLHDTQFDRDWTRQIDNGYGETCSLVCHGDLKGIGTLDEIDDYIEFIKDYHSFSKEKINNIINELDNTREFLVYYNDDYPIFWLLNTKTNNVLCWDSQRDLRYILPLSEFNKVNFASCNEIDDVYKQIDEKYWV
jgi:hypothetical protein